MKKAPKDLPAFMGAGRSNSLPRGIRLRFRIFEALTVIVLCVAPPSLLRAGDFLPRETVFAYPGDGNDVGQYGNLKHDLAGNLHAAYYDATRGDLKYAFGVRDPLTGVVTWTVQRVDTAGDVGRYCSMALTLDARPVISYYDATHGDLKVAFDENGDRDFEQDATVPGVNDVTGYAEIRIVDNSSPNTGRWTSIVIDDDNHFHVSYKDQTHGSLRYALYDGTLWTTETVDPGPQVGNYSSIVVDNRQAQNIPYIFYQDEANQDLRGARRLGAAWFPIPPVGPLDSTDDTGNFISAVITPANDRIYISYQNAVAGQPLRADLRMAILDELAPPTTEDVTTCEATSIVPCVLQPTTGDYGYYSSITLDRNGLPVIAHYDNRQGNLILERRLNTAFPPMGVDPRNIWDRKIRPEVSGDVGRFTTADQYTYVDPITSTDVDVIHIGSYDFSRTAMRLSAVTAGSISTANAGIIDGAKAGEFSSIALDPSGTPVVAYYDTVLGSLMLTRHDGPSTAPWSPPQLIDNSDSYRLQGLSFTTDPKLNPNNFQQSGQYVSMVMDPVGTAHLAYHDALRGQLRYATVDAATATNFFQFDQGPKRGEFASQAMKSDGSLFAVAYFQDVNPTPANYADPIGNGPRLRVAFGDGAANWTVESVDNSGIVGKYCSCVIDDAGVIHVSYFDETNFNLKYAKRTSTGWQTQTVEDSFDLDGQYTSIGINPVSHLPAISYYDLSESSLKFAQLTQAGWDITTVDDVGNVGLYSILRFDPTRRFEYIAYYDMTKGMLKVTAKPIMGPQWTLVGAVDAGGDLGARPSALVDPQGFLEMTYYDVEHGDLLYDKGATLLLNDAGPSWRRYR